ncbi:MAG: hypothetical protein Q9222_007258, partial [Ikaeria aurantiellina]
MTNDRNQHFPGSALDGSIDALWGVVRPMAVSLRDVIMAQAARTHSPIPSTDGTSSTSPIIPSVQNRRAACTHLTMERLYGDYDCMNCHRPSRYGWLYSCSQDDNESHLADTQDQSIPRAATIADLAPWIQRAIAQGHYTQIEIDELLAQRQQVINTIAASEAHFKRTLSTKSRVSSSKRTSVEIDSFLPFPVFTEIAGSTSNAHRQSIDRRSSTQPRIFPICRYRACQLCRPTYRDRSWQVLEEAFTTQLLPPDLSDNDPDRPISDATLTARIGTREPKATRPPLRALDSAALYKVTTDVRCAFTNRAAAHRNGGLLYDPEADLASQRSELDSSSKGFRDSVKRAFKGMLMTTTSNHSKRASWSSKGSKRSRRRMGDIPENNDSAEFDISLWRELSDELLSEAAGVVLPGHDGKDGLEDEEEEVE